VGDKMSGLKRVLKKINRQIDSEHGKQEGNNV